MPRKIISHPFQFELLRTQKDKARIERELKLRQRIYTFAELSDKERKRRFAFLIAEKQRAEQQSESSDDSELDSDSSFDVDTIHNTGFPNPKENSTKPFDSRELTLGLIIGILIGLCFGLVFPNQYAYLIAFTQRPLYR
jgi:hypothetical protein